MLRNLVLIIVLLSIAASAETTTMKNHTLTFEMKKPYIIQNNRINTNDGSIIFSEVRVNVGGTYVGYVQSDNWTYLVNTMEHYYLIYPINGDYSMTSNMNLTNTIDFLRSLDVEEDKGFLKS
jgi:hypothetical protein